jgi:hypothetical protein
MVFEAANTTISLPQGNYTINLHYKDVPEARA